MAKKIVLIKDVVHKTITLDKKVFIDLIDCREFQRLRKIKQLGNASLSYPSATHTRFSHSLGTYEFARKILKNSKEIKNQLTEKEMTSVKIASLLHDLGHGPFSHAFEEITGLAHEQYTIDIIKDPSTEIHKTLKKYNHEPFEIASIIEKTHPNKVLVKIVSSQVDADRMDYLLRDSLNTGTGYGVFDADWIINNMRIENTKTIFKRKAITSLEDYFVGRHHMYQSIYLHKNSIAGDFLVSSILKRAKDLHKEHYIFNTDIELIREVLEGNKIPIKKYIELEDYSMNHIISQFKFENDSILAELAQRYIYRKLPKIALIESKMIKENQLFNSQKEHHKNSYFFKKSKYSDVAYKREKKLSTENTYIETADRKLVSLEKYSHLISTLSKEIVESEYIFYINDNFEAN